MKLDVERLSLISDKPFSAVLSAIHDGIGQPDMDALWKEIWDADSFEKVEAIVSPVLGPTGLMQLAEFDDGGFIRKDRGEGTPQAVRLLIGNPLIMKQMTERVPDAGAYAPVTVFYLCTTMPKLRGSAEALDNKIERLMQTAA